MSNSLIEILGKSLRWAKSNESYKRSLRVDDLNIQYIDYKNVPIDFLSNSPVNLVYQRGYEYNFVRDREISSLFTVNCINCYTFQNMLSSYRTSHISENLVYDSKFNLYVSYDNMLYPVNVILMETSNNETLLTFYTKMKGLSVKLIKINIDGLENAYMTLEGLEYIITKIASKEIITYFLAMTKDEFVYFLNNYGLTYEEFAIQKSNYKLPFIQNILKLDDSAYFTDLSKEILIGVFIGLCKYVKLSLDNFNPEEYNYLYLDVQLISVLDHFHYLEQFSNLVHELLSEI